jgi:Na+-translocating ferredoxin:NAD+ oxidoreductase subunit B
MNNVILYTILAMAGLGAIAAVILFFVAEQFKVYEDPRIEPVQEALPGANCGACGYPGCRNFAEALVKAEDYTKLYCPVGGVDGMAKVAIALGKQPTAIAVQVAVVRCNGTPEFRPKFTTYEGVHNCAIAHLLYTGEGGCPSGCLSCGDCVKACKFDAIFMDPQTELPVVIDKNCTACGLCVKACPRKIIELRTKAKHDRKIFVSCVNEEKGAICIKNCKVACIACLKCQKICPFDAITINNNLAYIDPVKCRLCRKCEPECPTNSILEINFPPRKEKTSNEAIVESA